MIVLARARVDIREAMSAALVAASWKDDATIRSARRSADPGAVRSALFLFALAIDRGRSDGAMRSATLASSRRLR